MKFQTCCQFFQSSQIWFARTTLEEYDNITRKYSQLEEISNVLKVTHKYLSSFIRMSDIFAVECLNYVLNSVTALKI